MLFIRHRINTLNDLKTVPTDMGLELDLRDKGKELILHHDPFTGGERFEDLLKAFKHAFLILKVKSEGIEDAALDLLKKYEIQNYFFLDVSFPALIKLSKKGEKNMAVRFSEYEPVEQCLSLKDKVSWVWVDCFTKCPLDDRSYTALKKHFKLCLVSPELQQHPVERIAEFKQQLSRYEIDAVCTKRPDLWEK